MHIGIAGPIATLDVLPLLDADPARLPAGTGGAPLLAILVAELLRRGHRVSAFTLSSDLPLRADGRTCARGPGFELHYLPNRPRAWPPNGRRPGRAMDLYAFERAGMRGAIEAVRPDVVHAHWAGEFAWAALRTGLPHVVTCHDSPLAVARFERSFRRGAYRWMRAGIAWHVLRHARRVTTVSPYMVDQVRSLCRVPVSVVANPIAEHAEGAAPVAAAARPRLLMACNGWGPWKNGAAGLRAYALLRERLPAVELHLFGRDTQEGGPAWQAWRESGSPPHVVFHGAVAHGELLAAMAAADLLLHPALEESFGAVLAEAMSTGLPVVAGDASGAVPWVVGDAGVLVDVAQPQAMADAMLALLLDRERARELGRRGRERVRRCFSPAAVAEQYEREYEAAIAESARAPRGGA
jgi:glycosyltransferase involved in cell wall biosynthesis